MNAEKPECPHFPDCPPGGRGDEPRRGPALSVLIPAYNVAAYVEECLESVFSQDFADFEVIVVDDGSTDGTFAKLEGLAARDGRMALFRQGRRGQAAARNFLLDKARGKWLYYCDADDIVRPGAFSRMVSAAEDNDLDVLAFHGERFSDGAGPAGGGDAPRRAAADAAAASPAVVSGDEFYAERMEARAWSVFLWEKLFRADFVRRLGARFPDGNRIEDTFFVMRTVPRAGRVLLIGDVLYSHRIWNGSLSAGEFDRNNVPDYCAYLEELVGIARGGMLSERAEKSLAWAILMCARRIRKYWRRLDAGEREKVLSSDGGGVRWHLVLSTFWSDGEYRALKDDPSRKGAGAPRPGSGVPAPNAKSADSAAARETAGSAAAGPKARKGGRRPGPVSRVWNSTAKILRATLGRCLAFLLLDQIRQERKRTEKAVDGRLAAFQKRTAALDTLQKLVKVHAVNKEKAACEMELERDRPGTTGKDAPGGVVVSLTSYPGRIYDVRYTAHSLLRQTFRPERVVLWLGAERFRGREADLPESLLALRRRGLEIRFCDDVGPFTKLLPALSAFPDKTIVTADDDVSYPPNWLEALVNAHMAAPGAIWCRRVRKIVPAQEGSVAPYRSWKVSMRDETPSFANFITGVGGTLYPPDALDASVFDKETFLRLTPKNDDIWFWAMAVKKGTPVGAVSDGLPAHLSYVNRWRELGLSDDGTLCAANLRGDGNEAQVSAVLSTFPEVAGRLREALAGHAPQAPEKGVSP